jgi:lipopolysaccharide/colanic/teichoic acid biosynthesis glycosyltransferase
MLRPNQIISKRLFDITLAVLLIPFVLIPVILLIVIASIDTGKNGLFWQFRVGRNGRLFKLYKIRSLKGEEHDSIIEIKNKETQFGAWLRKHKLDELPQIWNILSGSMSWVGPRPDVPGYADLLTGEDRVILSVSPGLTGPATLKYKNEDELLLAQKDPQSYNDDVIWPDKVEINKQYIKNWSLLKDIEYIIASV